MNVYYIITLTYFLLINLFHVTILCITLLIDYMKRQQFSLLHCIGSVIETFSPFAADVIQIAAKPSQIMVQTLNNQNVLRF